MSQPTFRPGSGWRNAQTEGPATPAPVPVSQPLALVDIQAALIAKYSLRDLVIVPAASGDELYKNLGAGGAKYFRDHVERNFRVGFSCANTIHTLVRNIEPFRLAMDAYPISFNVVPELTSVMSSYAALIELWQRNPECRAHAVNFPSFFASESERAAFENRPDVRTILGQVRDVNMAFYSCGAFGPGSSYGVVKEYVNRFIDPAFDPHQLYEAGACGEVNWHPYALDGRIMSHPVPYSFGFVDLATFRELSRRADRHMVLVAGGTQKVEPIVGALRGGFLNVLITDERTLRSVAGIDASLP
ncbi:sugar-binding domain-containing protein [Actinomadura macra]|uniref:sugar-binding domain-containing protein n=1 Tax=Actinomadura macra TaxID=46164 RepID=UPI000A068B47|nr:sugar-binding domain-containing protein [Actinomadura macra]